MFFFFFLQNSIHFTSAYFIFVIIYIYIEQKKKNLLQESEPLIVPNKDPTPRVEHEFRLLTPLFTKAFLKP